MPFLLPPVLPAVPQQYVLLFLHIFLFLLSPDSSTELTRWNLIGIAGNYDTDVQVKREF